jgi:hydrogenase expression/formation protein HypD
MSKHDARFWLQQVRELPLIGPLKVMNVCGGHERSISMAGIRSLLPENIELIPGPGCPVCICPEEDIYQAMQLALHENVILVAFGDMLRVPVNVPKNEARTLQQAAAAGADIRPIASPLEAVQIAQANPDQPVVFFAAGFETTTAPVAAMVAQGLPDNLFLLLSGRLTWPAVAMLLDSDQPGFDALIAPGHVSTVMGPEEWQFVVDRHHLAVAVAGFEPDSLLAALYSVLRQTLEGRLFLDNCYAEVAHAGGNPTAQHFLNSTMEVVDSNWRGVGTIPASGYALKPAYAAHDARLQFPDHQDPKRRRIGEMPPGCDCTKVVLGKIYPNQCRLFGTACTPRQPIGPCMVSDEGACRIWWSSGTREPDQQQARTTAAES